MESNHDPLFFLEMNRVSIYTYMNAIRRGGTMFRCKFVYMSHFKRRERMFYCRSVTS